MTQIFLFIHNQHYNLGNKETETASSPRPDNINDISYDSNRGAATRSSTCSLPITEQSKRLFDTNNSAKMQKHQKIIDMPLQRNVEGIDVSPIIEDDKEDTQYNEPDSSVKLSNKKRLFDSYIGTKYNHKLDPQFNKENQYLINNRKLVCG